MGRWAKDAQGRLQRAAFELFVERGFAETTVAEIAERAGLTERTFFRHFADKREVLFSGASDLVRAVVLAVECAPVGSSALGAATAGVEAACATIDGARGREFARARQRLVSAHGELRERELVKLASMATAVADALVRRGVDATSAQLTSEVTVAAFRVAFARWVDDDSSTGLRDELHASLARVARIVTPPSAG